MIICVSKNTERDLLNYYPWINKKQIKIIYNGVSNTFHPLEVGKRKNDKGRFILYVGSREVHKNFQFVLNIMNEKFIKKNNIKLITIGGGVWTKAEQAYIERNNLKESVIQKHNIDDHNLNRFYNKAHALIYPSLYEGFGIPILEAMKSGCPVICSKNASIPEVAGDAGLYIDNHDYQKAINYIKDLFGKNFRNDIIKKGFINSKKFSWEKTGNETIKLYHKVLGLR